MQVEEPVQPPAAEEPSLPPVDAEAEAAWKSDSTPVLTQDQEKALDERRKELSALIEAARKRREALNRAGEKSGALRELAAWMTEGGKGGAEAEAWIDGLIQAEERRQKQGEKKQEALERRLEKGPPPGKGPPDSRGKP